MLGLTNSTAAALDTPTPQQYSPTPSSHGLPKLSPPDPKLVLEKLNGDAIKYRNFTETFKDQVTEAYLNYKDKMAYLELGYVGEARDVISRLSCIANSQEGSHSVGETSSSF